MRADEAVDLQTAHAGTGKMEKRKGRSRKKKAESDEYGFLENADKNAKKVIKSMFKNVADGKDVVVTFQN